jgi:hypothetical protein
MGETRHTAPSLRLFHLEQPTMCHLSFLGFCLQIHFPVSRFRFFHFPRLSLYNRYIHSIFKTSSSWAVSWYIFNSCYHTHPVQLFCVSLPNVTQSSKVFFSLSLSSGWGWCFYITGSHSTCSSFLRFGGAYLSTRFISLLSVICWTSPLLALGSLAWKSSHRSYLMSSWS